MGCQRGLVCCHYRDGAFLGPRIGDKIFMGLLVMTLYLNAGNNYNESNLMNIAAVLFMMCVLPSFGAAAYVPALVLGEWQEGRHLWPDQWILQWKRARMIT